MTGDPSALVERLETLRSLLRELPAGPAVAGAEDAARVRRRLADQIDDYLLPRLRHIDAPILIGIGGSTGAGKSTITNTLIGDNVSRTGLLRPTTRTPVLVCHPDDYRWFMEGDVLPDLGRSTGSRTAAGTALAVHTSERMAAGMAILDTPDIDSVEIENHELAAQLLGSSDLWLFVTTAARYADAVPWDYLRTAAERSTALAIVINRIPPGAIDEVSAHFETMLAGERLAGTVVFPIEERELVDDRLSDEAMAPLRRWLDELAADAERRGDMVRSTIGGAIASVPERVERVARGVERQAAAAAALLAAADQEYAAAYRKMDERLAGGTLLRQEVLSRWQEFVGAGQFMLSIQSGVARIRDRLKAAFLGTPSAAAEVQGEVQSSLTAVIVEAADAAADAAVEQWESAVAGQGVLGDDARRLSRVSPGLAARAEAEIELWQDFVLGLVRQQAEGKRLFAQTLSLGINTVGVMLMVVLFAQTGGITGGEVAVAGGTATVSQALLTAIFGENAVRDLARQARTDLLVRIQGLLDTEAGRFHALLAGLPTDADADALRRAADAVKKAA